MQMKGVLIVEGNRFIGSVISDIKKMLTKGWDAKNLRQISPIFTNTHDHNFQN